MNTQGHIGFMQREASITLSSLPMNMQERVLPYFSYYGVAEDDGQHLTSIIARQFFDVDGPCRQELVVRLPQDDGHDIVLWLVKGNHHHVDVKLGPVDALAYH